MPRTAQAVRGEVFASLSLRLTHGVQVWNTVTSSFTSKNKYRGREIKTPDFHRVLHHFLHDGDHLLVAHIPVIIQKLHNLAAILLKLDGFRFYGCSLLLIYDGDKEAQDHFARHSSSSREGEVLMEQAEEEGEWVDLRHQQGSTAQLDKREVGRRSKSVETHHHHHHHHHRNSRRPPDASNTRRLRGEVNIRVVDFAHTTTGRDFVPFPPGHVDPPEKQLGKGYDTQLDPQTGLNLARFPPKHLDSPDLGFIFGLQNVCAALEGIWRTESGDTVVDRWIEEELNHRDIFSRLSTGTGELST